MTNIKLDIEILQETRQLLVDLLGFSKEDVKNFHPTEFVGWCNYLSTIFKGHPPP